MNPNYFGEIKTKNSALCFLILTYLLLLAYYIPQITAEESSGELIVVVRGYDEKTPMQVSLLDENLNYLKNLTITASSFNFKNLQLGKTYYVLINYKGIYYHNFILMQRPRENLIFQVYDITDSDESIVVDFHHIIIQYDGASINVAEVMQFRNIGDYVYNGSLKISMPRGFSEFNSQHACCLTETPYGFDFIVPQPLKPGEQQLLDLTYKIATQQGELTFTKQLFYNTTYVLVAVEKDAISVKTTTRLEPGETVQLDNKMFTTFILLNGSREEELNLVLSPAFFASVNWLWTGTGVMVAIIVGVVVYGLRGSRGSVEELIAKKEATLAVLQQIEKDYQDGAISELEYLKSKVRYKERLARIEKRLERLSAKGGGG